MACAKEGEGGLLIGAFAFTHRDIFQHISKAFNTAHTSSDQFTRSAIHRKITFHLLVTQNLCEGEHIYMHAV